MVRLRRSRSFRREFKRQIKYALIIAIGFIIAYAWREAIFKSAEKIVSNFSETTSLIGTELFTSLSLTFIGVVLIFITSKLLRD